MYYTFVSSDDTVIFMIFSSFSLPIKSCAPSPFVMNNLISPFLAYSSPSTPSIYLYLSLYMYYISFLLSIHQVGHLQLISKPYVWLDIITCTKIVKIVLVS